MSRLDSFIRRMMAQRDVIAAAASLIDGLPGPILELGLGNGRTYHHLRETFPDRRIIAFDRALAAHSASIPPPGDLVLGEIDETARAFAGIGAALVHADIATGTVEGDRRLAGWLPALIRDLLAPGGIAASGSPLELPDLRPLTLPAGVPEGRYFLYRRA
ncbi:hypothetical protein D3874_27190 [Oleomonas cavernae]|uniref:S-adenosyl-L-methionine methyltransferase n=2 Tax=Oleomonas cavernae TaxID=2320859 RepID=A0A418VUD4_9PROT|nr:hypothetical protein D3874_27190 [Oleomonas cavernae]